MTELGNEIFRLVSLRSAIGGHAIDPSEFVERSVVLTLLQGIKVDVSSPSSDVLGRLGSVSLLSLGSINAMALKELATALYSKPKWTPKELLELKFNFGTQSLPAKDIPNNSNFVEEYRKIFDSWLVHRLKHSEDLVIAQYERLLLTGHLCQILLHRPDMLGTSEEITKHLHAYCKLPSSWRELSYRRAELDARHNSELKKQSMVGLPRLNILKAEKRRRWENILSDIRQIEAIRSQVFKEYFAWTKQTTPRETVGLTRSLRLQRKMLNEQFFSGLKTRLDENQKAHLQKLIAHRPAGSPVDVDDLITDLDTKILTSEANDLCQEIQALEEQDQNELPVAPSPPQDAQQPMIRGIGWGDLVVAREKLVGYQAKELAHIENILTGEKKIREHERTNTTEEITETETITEKETERDSQSTDRYELQNQSQTVIQQNFALQAGLNTSGRYGLTHVDTSLNTGFQQSKTESRNNAQNISKEIVSKAVDRTFESVRKLRRLTITESIRELNRHELSNIAPDGTVLPAPITGAYLWAEKVHQVELRHYGTRLMIEFHIPEPGVSLLQLGNSLRKKRRLPPFGIGPEDINIGNYLCKSKQYQALDVEPPPPQFINVGYSTATTPSEEADGKAEDAFHDMIAIPDGYEPKEGIAMASGVKGDEPVRMQLTVGGIDVITEDEAYGGTLTESFQFNPALPWPNGVPFSLRAKGHFDKTLIAQVVLLCERTPEAMTKWQLRTWEKLRAGYENLLRQTDRQVELDARMNAVFGNISGDPMSDNIAIEQEELQKWAIKVMRLKPHDFNAMEQVGQMQEPSPINADMQAPIVKFFEEAFEWKLMSYFLYPYFWARRDSWITRNNTVGSDRRHTAFLKAGAARVIVPVTPGYEKQVLYYLESDPKSDELNRIKGPPSEEMPAASAFEDLWLELLSERRADVARGSGSLNVVHGSDIVKINEDSIWYANERDLGREIYIQGNVYTVDRVIGEHEFRIDREFGGLTETAASYATGSVPYGQPWLVNVPTSLVILSDNRNKLQNLF